MKRLGIILAEELHKKAKIKAIGLGITLTDYIVNLIEEDLKK